MNYNTLMNKPTINYRELIGDNTVSEVGGITEEEFNTLMNTDLASYYTKAQIDDLFSRSYVYREKSGSIVTFDCPASVNGIDKVVSDIVAVQSGNGDPSPTNVRPFIGWSAVNRYRTGKNFYNPSFTRESGYYDDNGVLQASNTAGHTQLTPINYNTYYYYSIHARSIGGKFAVYFWDSNGNWISRVSKDYSSNFDYNNMTFTTPSNCRYISFQVPIGTGVTSLEFDDSLTMICLNSLGTDFEPYNGTTYTTALKDGQGNPLVCYGGTLSNENGVQTLTDDFVFYTFTGNESGSTYSGGGFYLTTGIPVSITRLDGMCDIATMISTADNLANNQGVVANGSAGVGAVAFKFENVTTFAEFKTLIAGHTVRLKRSTPQQIPQDNLAIATQEGVNNIWADSGDITVKALDKIIQE